MFPIFALQIALHQAEKSNIKITLNYYYRSIKNNKIKQESQILSKMLK